MQFVTWACRSRLRCLGDSCCVSPRMFKFPTIFLQGLSTMQCYGDKLQCSRHDYAFRWSFHGKQGNVNCGYVNKAFTGRRRLSCFRCSPLFLCHISITTGLFVKFGVRTGKKGHVPVYYPFLITFLPRRP
jgi:hypothetical protein